MKKRVLAFLMCLCLCMSLLPAAALADETAETYNVCLTVNYPADYTGVKAGGLNIYDENGAYLGEYNESTVIKVPVGEMLIVRAIEMKDLSLAQSWSNCGDMEINGEIFIGFEESGSVELNYIVNNGVDSGEDGEKEDDNEDKVEDGGISEGDSIVGLTPATEDFEIRISVSYPEGYEGSAGGFYRVDENNEPYGDRLTDGDVVQVKAGELPTFRIVDIEGIVYNMTSNGVWRPSFDEETGYSYVKISGVREAEYASLEIIYISGEEEGGPGEGEGPLGPVVSEDDYEIVLELGHEGFAEDELVGGGIVVFDEDGNHVGTYTESTTIPVSGGTKFLFRPIHVYGSDWSTFDGVSGTENGCYACYDDSTVRLVYTSCGTGGTESNTAPGSDYTVDFTLAYDGFDSGMGFGGGIVVFDENGDYVATYTENQSITVPGGTMFLFQEISIPGAYGSLNGKQGELGRFGVRWEAGEMTFAYTFGGEGGDSEGPMGPQPAVMDFDVAIRVELPERYEGDGKVVTRKARENGDGPLVDFGDGAVYGDGDTVSVKAGEWAIFGAEAIDGYAVEYIFNNAGSCGTMNPDGNACYAVIESVDYGDAPVELVVRYVSTAGITLNWYDSILRPDTGFGVGGLDVTETLSVLYDGEQVSDFTVTNENDDVCTVEKNGANIFITSVGYGDSDITVTVNGETATFTWCCDHGITINYVGSDSFIPAGVDIGREPGTYEMEVRVYGENIDDFDVYSSDENVCVVNKDGATLIINCVGSGRCIITIEHNGIVAEYNWICDESIYQGISLAPEEALDGAIPAGARFGMPVWGEYRYKVRLDTFFVGNFTVTSDNTDLCEVRNENGWLVVNSKGYGETPIHITEDGTTVDFTWVCMEPAMSVKPPEAGAPKTDAALNGGSTVVSDITEDGNGSVLVISSTIGNETSNIVVHTDNMEAIEEALEDENVSVGVVFGSRDVTDQEVSQEDEDAADAYYTYQKELYADREITAIGIMDIFAELSTVYPDRPGERLGDITEMDEMIEFSMTVKKSTLEELGRDIHNLFILHLHNGEWEEVWKDGGKYVETDDSYILYFETNRFSSYVLGYDRVIGDIDGDDKPAEPTDLIRMMKYIAGEDVTVVADSVDVNGDGRGDILDVIRLMRAISGEDVELS